MSITVFTVNAFTHNGSGGNPAGIVLDASSLNRSQKQSIAAAMGYSETVFVRALGNSHYQLEYFTPVAEVPLCGHATIATFVLLLQQGRIVPDNYTIHTLSGELTVKVLDSGKVFMQQCAPEFSETYPASDFDSCISSELASSGLPIQTVSTGLRDIMYPMASVEQLAQLKPDFEAMAQLNRKQNVVSIHAFALDTAGDITAVCRNFAPAYDIPEESATGTSNCALACYLHRYHSPNTHYVFEQGHQLGKVSRIEVLLEDPNIPFVGGMGQVISCQEFSDF